MVIYFDIETATGVYKLRKPMGRAGAIHFGILTKSMPSQKKNKDDPMSPAEQERISNGFEEWAAKVLPNILVGFTPKGASAAVPSITIDDMSGEDQYSIFLAICSHMEVSESFFRFV